MEIKDIKNNPQTLLLVKFADLREIVLEIQAEKKAPVKTDNEEYFTPKEVCERYKVSKTTLWRNGAKGIWPTPIKIGNKTLYRKSEIEAKLKKYK